MQEYRRRKLTFVTADRGDWIVNNNSEVYTVDDETFQGTYRMPPPGLYEKTGSVWAEEALEAGTIETREGSTAYSKGDYLVFNDPDRKDGYAICAARFSELYEPK